MGVPRERKIFVAGRAGVLGGGRPVGVRGPDARGRAGPGPPAQAVVEEAGVPVLRGHEVSTVTRYTYGVTVGESRGSHPVARDGDRYRLVSGSPGRAGPAAPAGGHGPSARPS